MYGLAPFVNPAFEHRNPVAAMYQAWTREQVGSGPTLGELAVCRLRKGREGR
jgi:hypothetical protein